MLLSGRDQERVMQQACVRCEVHDEFSLEAELGLAATVSSRCWEQLELELRLVTVSYSTCEHFLEVKIDIVIAKWVGHGDGDLKRAVVQLMQTVVSKWLAVVAVVGRQRLRRWVPP